ncbi:MAG: DUF4961 domain-containing protein, partial [candidate division KSB1 bacterium]|nr:DUF4961 domain-containing protein [candidate division KSB1 bacterium]
LFVIAAAIILPLLSACFTILEVDQPTTAKTGETISVYLQVRTEDQEPNPHYGIIGMLIPNDWSVKSVKYSGDIGPDECSFLHPDSADGDPGGQVDYWTKELENRLSSGADMQWVVYQANTPYNYQAGDTAYIDVQIELNVGTTLGKYEIGYFVTNAALDFTEPEYYSFRLENPITVIQGTGVKSSSAEVPGNDYQLSQNYPNPFNPLTTIQYDLPKAGLTTLKLYNLLGEEVAVLLNEYKAAGSYQLQFDASKLESGVYYYKIKSGDFEATKKLVLVK